MSTFWMVFYIIAASVISFAVGVGLGYVRGRDDYTAAAYMARSRAATKAGQTRRTRREANTTAELPDYPTSLAETRSPLGRPTGGAE